MNSIQGKLATLSAVNNIGHSFFECRDINSAAMYICIQTQKVIPFERSIIACDGKILAVSGQNQISKSSSLAEEIRKRSRELRSNQTLSILKGILPETSIIHLPLICPVRRIRWEWFIEINKPDQYTSAAVLLGKHFSEGLLHLYRNHSFSLILKSLLTLPFLCFLSFVVACFYIKVPEKIIAPLEVKALHSEAARSSLAGLVESCIPEGTKVQQKDILAKIDASEYKHQLDEAYKNLIELKIKLDKANNDSLNDNNSLIEIQLLKNEEEKLNLKIDFLEKKISQNVIKARTSGTVRYLPEISLSHGTNIGRFLEQGEVLCFIDALDERVAEISIAENDIHLLKDHPELYLYYHTSPDRAFTSKIIDIKKRPVISELSRQYVYKIYAQTSEKSGVTGTAHFRGKKVMLGYYLFKKIYFYLREF